MVRYFLWQAKQLVKGGWIEKTQNCNSLFIAAVNIHNAQLLNVEYKAGKNYTEDMAMLAEFTLYDGTVYAYSPIYLKQ
jgi:hypothetical protein